MQKLGVEAFRQISELNILRAFRHQFRLKILKLGRHRTLQELGGIHVVVRALIQVMNIGKVQLAHVFKHHLARDDEYLPEEAVNF